jgi:hypothetical protein
MNRRGNVVIAVLFVLLLSFSGMALLTHTLLHDKIVAARRGRWEFGGEMERTVLWRLHLYRLRLDDSDMNRFSAPENDFFNLENFPDTVGDGIRITCRFNRQPLAAGSGFSKLRIFNCLTAESEKSRLEYQGRASVDLLMGDIPLSEFSLLVNKEMIGTQTAYLAEKGVEGQGQLINLPGKPAVAGDGRGALVEAMMLPGPFPDWRQIREKFNLEPSDAPIPRGIYLSSAAGLVEAVFVEGDLQQLEFRAVNGLQSIIFGQDSRLAELSYRPGLGSFLWSGSEAVGGNRFAEKIIVHGNIRSITQSGAAAFAAGSRIEVMASGKMIVTSGLAGENLGLQKAKFANLLLMTGDRDYFNDAAVNADIVLAVADNGTVEAHLLAAGSVVHGDGVLKISGSLVAGDIENSGRLQVRARAGRFDFPAHLVLKNFKCLQNFIFHFISEASDE